MTDPYKLLGVGRDATVEEIRKAYRSLAKKNHPDLHPGDKAAEARFKDIASAYAIIGDEAKRALFDGGKIDASGAELHQQPDREFYRQYAGARPGFKYEGARGNNGTEDLFADLFGRRGHSEIRGADVTYTLAIEFIESVMGTKKRVVMADGKVLDLIVPAGLQDGQTLRMRGQGHPGSGAAEPGDILIEMHVKPHPVFRRDGKDIYMALPITIGQALGGGKVPVDTVTGPVSLTVPKGSNTGTKLRLRGKGVPAKDGAGDQIVELTVVLPNAPDEELIDFVVGWEARHPYDPNKGARTSP